MGWMVEADVDDTDDDDDDPTASASLLMWLAQRKLEESTASTGIVESKCFPAEEEELPLPAYQQSGQEHDALAEPIGLVSEAMAPSSDALPEPSGPVNEAIEPALNAANQSSTTVHALRQPSAGGPTLSTGANAWKPSAASSPAPVGGPTLSIGANTLFKKAMLKRSSTVEAMHPMRAHAAGIVLRNAKNVLSKEGLPIDSGSEVVRKLFFDSMPDAVVKIESIEQLIHPDMLRRFLKVLASGTRNSVEATFHGARSEHINGIMRNGLSPELCVIGANGNGAYVGCHAGVAHQYASPDAAGLRHMCVVLVVVGDSVVKGEASVVPVATSMDRLKNPTQYCFVDEERLLASHVVRYRVVGDGRRRVGGGWDDPFARKLNSAIVRAGKRERRGGDR